MGPFPHDAPRPTIDAHNPMGTDGFAFVEYAHPEPQKLHALFRQMGFSAVARHRERAITLYRQGDINYLVNEAPGSHALRFAAAHGPSVPSMAFRVVDARHAYRRALELGAEPADPADGALTMQVPAIKGIGGSLLYFIDSYGETGSTYDAEFAWLGEREPCPKGAGLFYIDHLTHNVHRGRMEVWYEFYRKLFNFRQIRYFDIKGEYTGLFSRALTSPDGRIRIPLNESADDESQIEEYLRTYKGEGIQHIACGCNDIYATIEGLRAAGLSFMPSPPDTYYERVDARLPGHGEDIARLKRNGILVDGEGVVEDRKARLLLQIFSANVIGPVFFEFIERKGDDGFGEGNFRALFESIEEDQIRRGVLGKAAHQPAAAR
ncbi:MAG TPA: 4-hydroxyphenylpyruvate dioxygenase [Roseomonas sp.]|nr:4-hydroxyphenylpyruvate dioxygenase [Roseomonas sp.]